MIKCQIAGCENDAEVMCYLTERSNLYCPKHFYEVFFPVAIAFEETEK